MIAMPTSRMTSRMTSRKDVEEGRRGRREETQSRRLVLERAASTAQFLRQDAAVDERRANLVRSSGAVERLRRGHDAAGEIGHRRAREVELSLDDRRVGLDVADRVADVPQRA